MKKYVIEFLKRGMLFGGFGPLIAGVVYLIISIYTEFTLSPVEVFLAIISTYLLAFIQAGASIFNQMDMPILKTMALHFSFIYIAYVSCYLINSWIPFKWEVIIIFTAIFLITYLIIWLVIYLIINNTTKKMNKQLI